MPSGSSAYTSGTRQAVRMPSASYAAPRAGLVAVPQGACRTTIVQTLGDGSPAGRVLPRRTSTTRASEVVAEVSLGREVERPLALLEHPQPRLVGAEERHRMVDDVVEDAAEVGLPADLDGDRRRSGLLPVGGVRGAGARGARVGRRRERRPRLEADVAQRPTSGGRARPASGPRPFGSPGTERLDRHRAPRCA